jgi:hypothetical protein
LASLTDHLPVVKALVSSGATILAVNNYGSLPIYVDVRNRNSEVRKHLLREFYATTRRLPLHELLKDLTWISDANITTGGALPLRIALDENVLGTNDVVEIVEFLVDQTLHCSILVIKTAHYRST